MSKQTFSVLVVDDSDDDRLFICRALQKNPGFAVVGELPDGDAAIAYLAGDGGFANREKYPYPDVLLLDLKLPKKTGYEVLEWLQQNDRGGLSVVVLSGSFLPEDIVRSRELGADAFFKKEPMEEERLAMIVEMEKMLRTGVGPLQSAN
jgi:CheY-like chemotaxis protein